MCGLLPAFWQCCLHAECLLLWILKRCSPPLLWRSQGFSCFSNLLMAFSAVNWTYLLFMRDAMTCHSQLSLCEYDPGTRDLKTLSLHYFEDEELRVSWSQDRDIIVLIPHFTLLAFLPGWLLSKRCSSLWNPCGPWGTLRCHAGLWLSVGCSPI